MRSRIHPVSLQYLRSEGRTIRCGHLVGGRTGRCQPATLVERAASVCVRAGGVPTGLVLFSCSSQGLRPGLKYFAARRLELDGFHTGVFPQAGSHAHTVAFAKIIASNSSTPECYRPFAGLGVGLGALWCCGCGFGALWCCATGLTEGVDLGAVWCGCDAAGDECDGGAEVLAVCVGFACA